MSLRGGVFLATLLLLAAQEFRATNSLLMPTHNPRYTDYYNGHVRLQTVQMADVCEPKHSTSTTPNYRAVSGETALVTFQHLDFFSARLCLVGQVENLRAGWQPALSRRGSSTTRCFVAAMLIRGAGNPACRRLLGGAVAQADSLRWLNK